MKSDTIVEGSDARLNGSQHWDAWTIVLHWVSAALIFVLLGIGFVMVYGGLRAAPRFDLYQLHKSLGFVALALVLVRIVTRLVVRAPAPEPTLSRSTILASTLVHLALYAALLLEALTGWLFVSASIVPIPTKFFRLFVVPNLVGPDIALSSWMAWLHLVIAWVVTILVAGHVLAALKHHVVNRDDVLRRMLSSR